jgi:ketosteroid isomerase-like protein
MKRAVEHWRAGRIREIMEALDPEIESDISAHPLPDFPDRGKGRDALMRHNADYLAGWDDYEVTVEELIDGGDDVVLVMHERTRMRGSEAILERDLPSVLTVRDGRCVRYRVFKTRAQALEAAGLPE